MVGRPPADHWVDRPDVEGPQGPASRPVLTGRHKQHTPPHPHHHNTRRHGEKTTGGTPQGTRARVHCTVSGPTHPHTHPHTPTNTVGTCGQAATTPHPPPHTHTHARSHCARTHQEEGRPGTRPARQGAAHTQPHTRPGGHSGGATPGPIPNPEAKTPSADGTAPARVRESRTPPDTHHTPPCHHPPHTQGDGGRAARATHTHTSPRNPRTHTTHPTPPPPAHPSPQKHDHLPHLRAAAPSRPHQETPGHMHTHRRQWRPPPASPALPRGAFGGARAAWARDTYS